jgi:glycosyltransferase involved in cell wall biosynthesis
MVIDFKYRFKTWVNWIPFARQRPEQSASLEDDIPDRSRVLETVGNIIDKSKSNKVIVITPSTGSQLLTWAIKSICDQDYLDLKHLIVVDGCEFLERTVQISNQFASEKLEVLMLPENTGRNGMNGHRIYAAVPFLMNAEYIFFLDQDNWFEPNHVSSMIKLMESENLDWTFAMRKVYKENGEFITNDNCESLGDYQCYSRLPNLVDTNCYGFKRSTLVKSAHYWYHPLRADRYFFHHLKEASPKFKSTGLYSVNYRLTENRPPSPGFFLAGNQYMLDKYQGKLPWIA